VNDAALELIEADGYGEMFRAAPDSVRRAHGIDVCEVAGATCILLGAVPGQLMLNRVNGLGLRGPVADAHLDEIDAFFRSGGTQYAIGVSPLASPDLAARLAERGFRPGYAWMKFRRGVEPPPTIETTLRVEQVGADRADAFGTIVARGFGLPDFAAEWFAAVAERPPFRLFLACDGDEPAGAGALFVGDGVGWLGAAATLPEHRRKGAQGAVLAARIRVARELGLRALATETGERTADRPSGSYRNILRLDFEEQYVRPNYVSPVGA
jgi:GNAT superfamily N-acetyltransferase